MTHRTPLSIVTDTALLQTFADAAADDYDTPSVYSQESTTDSDVDSLFGPSSEAPSLDDPAFVPPSITRMSSLTTLNSADWPCVATVLASRSAPSIPGLFFDPASRLPEDFAEDVMSTCIQMYFRSPDVDQVMLFERSGEPTQPGSGSGLPPVLSSLLSSLSTLLRPLLPPEKHELLFPAPPTPYARQAILNLYWPGDGITPHVDLLDRYGDGIIGVSFGSGCVMRFAKVLKGRGDEPASQRTEEIASGEGDGCGVYLPPGSAIVMTEEARYGWTHGIEKCMEDLVESEDGKGPSVVLSRDVRLSVTFRWLLPGADVVGEPDVHDPGPDAGIRS
ncbi:hypothetical protein EVJ58_g1175 [Rhodofomes roseus]|uniref:Fe2OG dioxygenase domain-containing protein n=1 Tax=Rhodofomes roseus TaxID=34475 RepID=A0A4Y9Z2Q0_9APHY|nr:hypothetical protein EVJ58_g1175 [Rhodofomes roseus]